MGQLGGLREGGEGDRTCGFEIGFLDIGCEEDVAHALDVLDFGLELANHAVDVRGEVHPAHEL